MTAHPLNLVGSFDDLRDRLVVQVEIDRRTGEVLSVSGDRDAIRRTCAFLLESIEPQEPEVDGDVGDHWDAGAASPRRLSDREARAKARPANILAALRRERERTAEAAIDVRTETDQCELVSRRDADHDDHLGHGDAFDIMVASKAPAGESNEREPSVSPPSSHDGSRACRRLRRAFVTGSDGSLRLVP